MDQINQNTDQKEIEFRSRKGVIVIPMDTLANLKEGELKALFSKFYPIATETSHNPKYHGGVRFYGYSPDFRLVDEGVFAPEYLVEVHVIELGDQKQYTIEFKEMVNNGQITNNNK